MIGNPNVILYNAAGEPLEVDASRRIVVSITPPTAPVGADAVGQSIQTAITGTVDTLYVITNGKTLTIQRVAGGAGAGTTGDRQSKVSIFEDPTGDLLSLNLIRVFYVSGSNEERILSSEFVGDGTRRILLRRERFDAGTVEVFAAWQGFEVTT